MTETWDSAGYIASSRYRLTVCEYLSKNGSGLPSRIAVETDLAQPHVSRALSELREQGIVELLVPDSQQKGRLYGLTDLGELAYERVALDNRVELSVVDSDEFPAPELIEELESKHGEMLRAIAWCEPDEVRVRFSSQEVLNQYDEDTMKTIVSTLVNQDSMAESLDNLPAGAPEFIVFGLEKALVVLIPLEDDTDLLVSVDKSFDRNLENLTETCLEVTGATVLDADD
ncbi:MULTISPECIES: winged helix-turn-helix domain-containing protein [Haloferax]|uniref:ArsR family transcriptional regulator n=1 Tax=Haloferax marinum TaxID=2666143 RepID=A0A6A8G4T2_9EURY|nr:MULTISPECIES: winged helix-turn-helix domain-containing protein [Haloferax]KAB1196370.1 winged helix-turn-helix transcriptional regulator [Haloferax sp. CBA1150]MRW95363.1 ArsR family transcriptional regulator [Haloferax marinum]